VSLCSNHARPGNLLLPTALVAATITGVTAADASAADATVTAAGRVVAVSSTDQLKKALSSAQPGDRIELGSGSYSGPFTLEASGTTAAPIRLTAASGASATLTANLPMPSCGATGPDGNRTIKVMQGASNWVIEGLTIRGGVMISSPDSSQSQNWFSARINAGDWTARRAVPGRGQNDPAAARQAAAYLSNVTNSTIEPSDNIALVGNTITEKGVHSRFSRYGVLDGNTITDIACGTGPGVWLANYSDGWSIKNNTVSKVAASTASHYMQEGIRIGGASAYNTVTANVVRDLPAGGRAFTTDQDGSWNNFRNNLADGIDIAYNDQMSGWGNVWDHNQASNVRKAGFSFRMKDAPLSAPSYDTSTNLSTVSCNVVEGSVTALQIGAIMDSTFRSNDFGQVELNSRVEGYWGKEGNTWNGSTSAPPASPATSLAGC